MPVQRRGHVTAERAPREHCTLTRERFAVAAAADGQLSGSGRRRRWRAVVGVAERRVAHERLVRVWHVVRVDAAVGGDNVRVAGAQTRVALRVVSVPRALCIGRSG